MRTINVKTAPSELREVIAAYFEEEEAEMDGFESMEYVEVEDLINFIGKTMITHINTLADTEETDLKKSQVTGWLLEDSKMLVTLNEMRADEHEMEINYSDLAQIVQAIADMKEFDGVKSVCDYMNKLEDCGNKKIAINKLYGATMFNVGEKTETGENINNVGPSFSTSTGLEPTDTNKINEQISTLKYKGAISDGSHTFDELYFHRMVLFSLVCKQHPESAWKSLKHDDGTMFDDYFIAGVTTPEGDYSYHYHIRYWNSFKGVKTLDFAPSWDGHKPEDITRLRSLTTEAPEAETIRRIYGEYEESLKEIAWKNKEHREKFDAVLFSESHVDLNKAILFDLGEILKISKEEILK